MIIKILATDTVAVSIRIISPGKDAGIRDIVREEIAEPMDAVRGSPSLVAVSVQAMDSNNAGSIRTGF
jgi:hypothetical protein